MPISVSLIGIKLRSQVNDIQLGQDQEGIKAISQCGLNLGGLELVFKEKSCVYFLLFKFDNSVLKPQIVKIEVAHITYKFFLE